MTNAETISKTADFIKDKFAKESSGHDWWHIYRVWNLAKHIASKERLADMFTVELAALLHDIADWKFHDGDMDVGPKAASQWLRSQSVDQKIITHIEDIIRDTSFKGAGVDTNLKTLEAKIVFDADKLDAIGAIGIARTFAFGGHMNRPIHDPDIRPELHQTFKQYRESNSPTINHFYEKLLLLKDLMQTKTGQQLANRRHKVMEDYLEEFHKEWDGEL